MTELLRLDRTDSGVVILTLDDPEKRNAIGPRLHRELLAVADEIRSDATARALVVTGAGTAFCAGADLEALFGDLTDAATVRRNELAYYESFLWIRDLKIPTIAAVQGHAVGAGANLALVCDIIVAGPDARFGITFARLGLHPGGGCTQFLTERLGAGAALRTILRGEVIGGRDAADRGLADVYADDPLAEALATAEAAAALDPRLAADMKQAVKIAKTGDFEATLGFESWAQASSAFHPGVIDAIRATGRKSSR